MQHFTSFKNLGLLKEERARANPLLRSFSIVDHLDDLLDARRNNTSENVSGSNMSFDYGSSELQIDPEDFNFDPEDIEKAKEEGVFRDLEIAEKDKEIPEEELKTEEEKKEDQANILNKSTNENLNSLVLKRMEALMFRAKNRAPLTGRMHEKRVKEIREGKFKICVPAVTLVFKYLVKMFKIIKEAMQDAIKNKQKSSFKKFMIYASKFSLISEVLFSAFYAKEEDILYKDLAHPDWEKFFEVFDFYEAEDLEKFNKQYKTLCEFLGKLSQLKSYI